MRVLTVRQPWADLIASGRKRVEVRTWLTSYRGPIAIHAGQHIPPEEVLAPFDLDAEDLDYGCIVAVATLRDVVPFEAASHAYDACLAPDPRPGSHAWLLEDVRELTEPIPYVGAQGLRLLPSPLAERLAAVHQGVPEAA